MNHIGLIIGRFQPFHKGHLLLVKKSLKNHKKTIVLIGSSNTQNNENPYNYELRKNIIDSEIASESLKIFPLPDFPNDTDWKNKILEYIPENILEVTLYCGDMQNDSAVRALKQFQNSLPFQLSFHEIPRSILPISATQIRLWIQEGNQDEMKKYLGEKTLEKLAIQ